MLCSHERVSHLRWGHWRVPGSRSQYRRRRSRGNKYCCRRRHTKHSTSDRISSSEFHIEEQPVAAPAAEEPSDAPQSSEECSPRPAAPPSLPVGGSGVCPLLQLTGVSEVERGVLAESSEECSPSRAPHRRLDCGSGGFPAAGRRLGRRGVAAASTSRENVGGVHAHWHPVTGGAGVDLFGAGQGPPADRSGRVAGR